MSLIFSANCMLMFKLRRSALKKTERKESCYSGIKKRSEGTIVKLKSLLFSVAKSSKIMIGNGLELENPSGRFY